MKSLTLYEVRKANVFAWWPTGGDSCPVYAPGYDVIYVNPYDDDETRLFDGTGSNAEWVTSEDLEEGGWHHLKGCECEFCVSG